jgi:hypothetical protein
MRLLSSCTYWLTSSMTMNSARPGARCFIISAIVLTASSAERLRPTSVPLRASTKDVGSGYSSGLRACITAEK